MQNICHICIKIISTLADTHTHTTGRLHYSAAEPVGKNFDFLIAFGDWYLWPCDVEADVSNERTCIDYKYWHRNRLV